MTCAYLVLLISSAAADLPVHSGPIPFSPLDPKKPYEMPLRDPKRPIPTPRLKMSAIALPKPTPSPTFLPSNRE